MAAMAMKMRQSLAQLELAIASRLDRLSLFVGFGNDHADRFLIETFKAAFALQIFQMTSDSAVLQELPVAGETGC